MTFLRTLAAAGRSIAAFCTELMSADPTNCPYCTGLRRSEPGAVCSRCSEEAAK